MHTRKSSPLPGPKDNINKYEIDYRTYYRDLHQNIIRLIQKQQNQKEQLIREFTKHAKSLQKLNKKGTNKQNENLEVQQSQIRNILVSFYGRICKKELEIKKLFDEAEGIILQSFDLLKEKQEQIRKIRTHELKSSRSKVSFLNYDRLQISMSATQYTNSLQENEFDSSFEDQIQKTMSNNEANKNKNLEQQELMKQLQIALPQNNKGNANYREKEKKILSESTKQNENENENEKMQLELPICLPFYQNQHTQNNEEVETKQNEVKNDQNIKERECMLKVQKSSKIIEEYAELQQKAQQRKQMMNSVNGVKVCIQINSSVSVDDSQVNGTNASKMSNDSIRMSNDHSMIQLNKLTAIKEAQIKSFLEKSAKTKLSSQMKQNNEGNKNGVKHKKSNLRQCITILD